MKAKELRMKFAKIGCKVSIRRVDFTDLARDYCFQVTITREGKSLPQLHTEGDDWENRWGDVCLLMRSLKGERLETSDGPQKLIW